MSRQRCFLVVSAYRQLFPVIRLIRCEYKVLVLPIISMTDRPFRP